MRWLPREPPPDMPCKNDAVVLIYIVIYIIIVIIIIVIGIVAWGGGSASR